MFRTINDRLMVSPQIGVEQVATAKSLGVGLIVNNRPEDESADQTPGATIAAAAAQAGIAYVAIPVGHSGFSLNQVDALDAALKQAGDAPVLAYCRSGTRSTLLWALTMARGGMAPARIAQAAADAGYDVSPLQAQIDILAAGHAGNAAKP
ncbi:TIGR01244 family sulfur transferase [Novosphingobium sp.]|uniref:TIGR01244 family sulfur transferase n=1 Tax=Novosphingobium sp. TaxID=1874826 RepID=UPI003B520E8E